MKAVHMDTWSIREKLCLVSAVAQEGDQDWSSVSRVLQPFLEPHRPSDWFSERSCALQYGALLEKADVPRRKKRVGPAPQAEAKTESPIEIIKKKLTEERIEELKKLMQLEKEQYLKDKEEIVLINCGYLDDQLPTMWAEIQEEKRHKEHEAKMHAQWLKDREERQKKVDAEQDWKPPVLSLQRRRKTQKAGRRRNSSQSSPGSEPDSTTVDSPMPDLLKMEVVREEPAELQPKLRVLTPVTLVTSTPTPSSPLLTSLLKSPSPAPSSQASSILHSAITSQRGASPTIASLLSSTPGSVPPPPTTVSSSLKNLVSSAIANGSEEHLKPQNTSPSAGAPTLSMLLELPPSLPGKPLPELPSVARQPAPLQLQPPPPPVAPPPQPLPSLPPAHPSTTPAEEVPHKTKGAARENISISQTVEVNVAEGVKEPALCDELTDEAVLEMVLASEDNLCPQPDAVPVASNVTDLKVHHGRWVRALDFGSEVKEQCSQSANIKLEKDDDGVPILVPKVEIIPEVQNQTDAEKEATVASKTVESNLLPRTVDIMFGVVAPENEKDDDSEVASEVEVATKQQSSSDNFIDASSEQSGVVVADITQEDFNIQEVEVAMSETVAEEVEIAGDEPQNGELMAPELSDISEQQVLEVIVGPGPSESSQDLTVELPVKEHYNAKEDVSEAREAAARIVNEVAVSTDVSMKASEMTMGNDETGQRTSAKSKRELVSENNEVKGDVSKIRVDVEGDDRKRQGDKEKPDEDKLRSKKKKHSKGKKKKHSREKRTDSKSRSKETDSKIDEKLDTTLEAKSDAKSEAKLDEKSDAKPSDKPDVKSDGKPNAKLDAKPNVKPDAKSDAKPSAKSDAKPDAKPNGKSDAKSDAKPNAKPVVKLVKSDKKTDTKSSEKKEVQNTQDEPKDKTKYDGKENVKIKDDTTEKEIQRKEAVKEGKRSSAKEPSPESVKASKEGSKKASESIQKDKNGKENGKQLETVSVADKKKKELGKETRPISKETESSKDVAYNSKESSKKEKVSMLEKQHRGHRKSQDTKNEDTATKEEMPRKEKKDVVRRDSHKDLTLKKSDKNSDSEGVSMSGTGSAKDSSLGSVPPTDEEDEKPLAEIVDEKKLQLVSNILAKDERPARSLEPQVGEDHKASDAEPSKVVSKKQRAAPSTPIDSVPNSPAASFTSDEEKEHKAWKKAIMLLYSRLATHKYASLFLRPITNDLAPGYSSYIYKPVDLQMIKKNIEIGAIRTTTEFQKEVMRMFKNAIMYNKSLHDVHLMALEMQEECLHHIEEFVATQMLAASVGETPSRRETRTMDAYKQKEFLRSPRANQEDGDLVKPSKRKRNDTSSDAPDHTPKRKTAED